MSTALPKFQPAPPSPSLPLDPSVLIAALDAFPEPIAISENGRVVYSNRKRSEPEISETTSVPGDWQVTDFQIENRQLTIRTRRRNEIPSGALHLALIGRMVGGVAHDFNNLLTGILLYCDLLQMKLVPADPLNQKIDEIRTAAEQGAGLIRQLMCIGREEKNARRCVYLNQAIRDLLPMVRHLVGENVQVTTTLDNNAQAVGLTLAQAQQVILNLVLNARDAMPDGGPVSIETRCRAVEGPGTAVRIVELVVCDCGQGMDARTASRMFEPFFTTKGPGQGTGMGLATVRKIVDDAGGMISVETQPRLGTRMIVHLPQVEPDASTSDQLETDLLASPNLRGAS